MSIHHQPKSVAETRNQQVVTISYCRTVAVVLLSIQTDRTSKIHVFLFSVAVARWCHFYFFLLFFFLLLLAHARSDAICAISFRAIAIFSMSIKKKLWSALNRLQLFTNFKSLISRLNTRIRLYNDTRENMLFVTLYIFFPTITTHHHHFSPYLSFLSFSQ